MTEAQYKLAGQKGERLFHVNQSLKITGRELLSETTEAENMAALKTPSLISGVCTVPFG